jgi:hypothetical protein
LDVSVPLVIGGAGKAMDPLASAAGAEVAKGAQAVGKAVRDATGGMGGGPAGGFAAAVGAAGAAGPGPSGNRDLLAPMIAAGEAPGSAGNGKGGANAPRNQTAETFGSDAPVNSKKSSSVSKDKEVRESPILGPSGRVSTEKYLESRWDKATFGLTKKSIEYHAEKHGKGLSAVEYTQQAENLFNNSEAKRAPTLDQLGRKAVLVRLGKERGMFTPNGKIIYYEPGS